MGFCVGIVVVGSRLSKWDFGFFVGGLGWVLGGVDVV